MYPFKIVELNTAMDHGIIITTIVLDDGRMFRRIDYTVSNTDDTGWNQVFYGGIEPVSTSP